MKRKRKPGAGRPTLDNPPTVVHVALRLYPGEDDDLLSWIDRLPKRQIAAAVKARLRTGRAPALPAVTGPDDDALDTALEGLLF
jgi:hypothetical protein